MKWSRRIVVWVLLAAIAGGLTELFLPPHRLAATTSTDQSSPSPSPEPTAYDTDVQILLDTTYLGHANELPDPGEPAEVLQKYLEQNAHGYQDQLITDDNKLADGLLSWEDLV